jgi:hypothetical protein
MSIVSIVRTISNFKRRVKLTVSSPFFAAPAITSLSWHGKTLACSLATKTKNITNENDPTNMDGSTEAVDQLSKQTNLDDFSP